VAAYTGRGGNSGRQRPNHVARDSRAARLVAIIRGHHTASDRAGSCMGAPDRSSLRFAIWRNGVAGYAGLNKRFRPTSIPPIPAQFAKWATTWRPWTISWLCAMTLIEQIDIFDLQRKRGV
jgi:hypothetical protein